MDRKIRVGAVSYLNTKPLIYGFQNGVMEDQIEWHYDYPANVAASLLSGNIDVGLVPLAILPLLKEYYFVGNHCIACDGPVASVCIFSEVPLEQVTMLILDYQSKTSVQLAKILLREYWKLSPELVNAQSDFRSGIQGTTAAVLIGDRALEQLPLSRYCYDLGAAWKAFTGLPFVFAAWISNKPLAADFIAAFDQANSIGLDHLEQVVAQNPYPHYNLMKYYTSHIKFTLDQPKRAAITLFLEKLTA